MRKTFFGIAACVAALATALATPTVCLAADGVDMYRLYNPNSGEHFYTASTGEKANLKAAGWRAEGTGWVAPTSGEAVYRVYNPNGGDHHYTMSAGERNALVNLGWHDEGVGWKSGGNVAVYRLYNPSAATGAHHYTTSAGERDMLVAAGWKNEGVGWYATAVGKAEPEAPASNAYIIDENNFVVGGLRFTLPAYWQGKVRLAMDGTYEGVKIYDNRTNIDIATFYYSEIYFFTNVSYDEDTSKSDTLYYPLPDGTYAACGGGAKGTVDLARHSSCAYRLPNGKFILSQANCAWYARTCAKYSGQDPKAAEDSMLDLYSFGTGSYDDWTDSEDRFRPFVEMWGSATRI